MPTPTLQSLEQFVDVETPEQVVFSYTIAGIGSRAAAALLDYLLIGILQVAVLFSLAPFVRRASSAPWVVAVLVLLSFVLFWGYYVLYEALWDGQTPGKRQFGLRVVRDGGYSITFGASAVRNLVRVIDLLPGTYGVGLISVAISPSGKRLGDYAAGTIVVRERAVIATVGALPVAGGDAKAAGTAVMVTAALTDDEFALLDRFIARRGTLDADRRAQLAEELAVRFRDRAPDLAGSDGAVLTQLFERERVARARGAAGRNDRGAAREQHAIVAQGAPRWQQFATLLASVQRRGLAHLSEGEISDFVARYRELAGDLARLQTAVKGRRIDSVFYLSRLVAGGHNLLYQERRLTTSAVWDYLTRTVPQEIRRSAVPIGIAAVLLFGPAAIAWVAVVRNPAVAAEFIPQGMIDRAEDGVQRAKRDEGYVPDFGELRPVTASAIMTNNVTITYAAFAGGILLGLGTIFVLISNGISLGGVMGLYQSKGILKLIVTFVAPHGVLELSAIIIAGGGGLLLASALLLPGAMTRREALIVRGRRAINLIAASTLLLIVAGSLEGFVSPNPEWTFGQKLTVSALTAVLLALYINLGRWDQGSGVRGQGSRDRAAGTAPSPYV